MPAGGLDADIWGEDDNARRYDAFARLGTGQPEPSRWIAFAARAS
jgi:hypothetical protein